MKTNDCPSRTETSHKQWPTTALPKVSNSIPFVPLARPLIWQQGALTRVEKHFLPSLLQAFWAEDWLCPFCQLPVQPEPTVVGLKLTSTKGCF